MCMDIRRIIPLTKFEMSLGSFYGQCLLPIGSSYSLLRQSRRRVNAAEVIDEGKFRPLVISRHIFLLITSTKPPCETTNLYNSYKSNTCLAIIGILLNYFRAYSILAKILVALHTRWQACKLSLQNAACYQSYSITEHNYVLKTEGNQLLEQRITRYAKPHRIIKMYKTDLLLLMCNKKAANMIMKLRDSMLNYLQKIQRYKKGGTKNSNQKNQRQHCLMFQC
uniref:Uncharacterized protein n=1 Tax=Romanomermis culicivorax TaxID=13658 RepID=A0A915I556_ROMCU